MRESTEAVELSAGGIPGKTEIMTTEGPIAVAGLKAGDQVYAMNAATKIVKPKPVTGIERFDYTGPLVHADARRIDWVLHPDHRVPYCTKAVDRIRFQQAGDLDEIGTYHLINDWRTPERSPLEAVDISEFVDDFEACVSIDCHGHTFRAALPDGCEPKDRNGYTGYHFDAETFKRFQDTIESVGTEVAIRDQKGHWRRPYRFDGDDFIRFIGWFVTEGSITRSTDRDSTAIAIAQKIPEYRERIEALFERLGINVHVSAGSYSFSSNLYARLLKRMCGEGCQNKHLPEFVWNLNTEQQELLLQVLMAGDGNDWKAYYTTSRALADDVLKLCIEISRKPRYSYKNRRSVWEIYVGTVNDRLSSTQHVSMNEASEQLYRLTVSDYSLVMAGRNGRFQWLGVSAVS